MQENESPHSVPSAPRPVLSQLFSWARDLAFSGLLAVILIVFIYQPVKVEGTSMEPGLRDQERIFINKFTYSLGLGDIRRGDTIVFRFPFDRPSRSYIKRVIGVPGDRIRIEAGQVYLNGRPLAEDYVTDRDTVSWPLAPEPCADRTAPPGGYFVLGDNRAFSSDSRAWGFVPRESVYGKAVFAYWPLARMGRLR
ncbi:MAG: signal peptidase I [Bryobacteraceae bacterium]|jgi:signal peptidase I